MGQYLGLDLSTQSFSAIIIDDESGQTIAEESVNFGNDLPGYNAPSGFVNGERKGEIFSDPCMWLDALDLLLSRLKEKTDLSDVIAVAGSGQQHATVYLKSNFADAVGSLKSSDSLASQLKGTLSRSLSPIWMDNSTSEECREIAQAVGGDDSVLKKSGSFAIERFSGAQIRKFSKTSPDDYTNTDVIHLASSFACSVLCGKNAPIDFGDGAGMNLLNLADNNWDKELLEACAPGLDSKLPGLSASNSSAGDISSYFVEKYGFSPDTEIFAFSGDNPNSLIGCGGALPGTAVISLGTSDTFFAAMSNPVTDPNGYGHVFGNPAGGYMSLICFRNGSLTREALKDHFALDWDGFSKALNTTTSTLQLPWVEDELTPKVPASSESLKIIDEAGAPSVIRQFVEGQFVNMYIHSEWMGEKINKIILTGGASLNNEIAQVASDVFGAVIERLEVSNSAALGAAMRALQAATSKNWDEVNQLFIKPDTQQTVTPQPYDLSAKVKIFSDKLAFHIASSK